MKQFRYVFAALALFLFVATAQAQEADRSGWAINAGIGGAIVRDEDGSETFRGSSFAYNTGIEYRMRNSLAIGFSYYDFGTANDTVGGVDTDISVDGIDFTLRFVFRPGGTVEPYALIGTAIYDADVSTGGGFSLFGDGAWEIGGGIDYHTSERTAIRFQARYLNGDRDESGGFATIGFNFRF
ncbi:MAG: porin family protein [Woeseiaceae bacterium]|nr:porin family protein [Woeseiaceae bacterium]